MLRQLVVARLEACNHFRVDLEAALARKLEVPGIALLFDLVELRQYGSLPHWVPVSSATWASFIAKIGS